MNKEISATDAAKQWETKKDTVFLDVREDMELEICRIEGAIHIPMSEVPDKAESLPRDQQIIVFCHHGMRSMNVLQYLEARGFDNVINLSGGIHAWALEVDTAIARY